MRLTLLLIPIVLSSAGFISGTKKPGLSSHVAKSFPAAVAPQVLGQPKTSASLRKFVVPALGYGGLVAVAAGAGKLAAAVGGVTLMGVSWPVATLAAVAAPALFMFVEFRFFGGGERVAKLMGGMPADTRLTELTAGVARRAGLPPPAHVFEIPTDELNAFAAGFGRADATVAVTSGLRQTLSNTELEAVIAHEIGHIQQSDMRTNMHVAVAIAGLSGFYNLGKMLVKSDRRGSRKAKGKDSKSDSSIPLGVTMMAVGIASRMTAHMLQLTMSRRAEFDADRVAAELCGSDAMISALSKIQAAAKDKKSKRLSSSWFSSNKVSAQQQPTLSSFRGGVFSHAYISDGKSDDDHGDKQGFWSRVATAFSTHPTTERRIAALQSGSKDNAPGH